MQKAVLIAFLLFSFKARSQSPGAPVTPAILNIGGGSTVINPNFVVDWNIGESTVIDTYHGENAYANSVVGIDWFVTSGVLQPLDKVHIIYNPFVPKWTNEEIRFYPVPTPNAVFIDFRSVTTGKISVQLYSHEGRLLGLKEFNQVNGTNTQKWDLTNKAAGVYYFHILLSAPNGDILKEGIFNIEKL